MPSSTLQDPPLLTSTTTTTSGRVSLRQQTLLQISRFLRPSLRQPSLLVREATAEHLEARQTDWAYSKPIVSIDIAWNICLIILAFVVMFISFDEKPEAPLRVWVCGYVVHCWIHILSVMMEYSKRSHRTWQTPEEANSSGLESPGGYVTLAQFTQAGTSVAAKHLGSANNMYSFVWWLLGFYWVSDAGQEFIERSPNLYWLCVVFLAVDVFFVVLFVALACLIGVALCCCLPCIIAILYVMTEQEGASKEEVEQLAKYKFRRADKKYSIGEMQGPGGVMTKCDTETPSETYLDSEDDECCICLSAYDDGAELRELPCSHHFHCTCVDKWLLINATCPLCKYNIVQNLNSGSQEV